MTASKKYGFLVKCFFISQFLQYFQINEVAGIKGWTQTDSHLVLNRDNVLQFHNPC